jgi:IS5 family transposase
MVLAALKRFAGGDPSSDGRHITYPTDSKRAINIINRLNKIAKAHDVTQRRTFVKEVTSLRLAIRHFRHVTK